MIQSDGVFYVGTSDTRQAHGTIIAANPRGKWATTHCDNCGARIVTTETAIEIVHLASINSDFPPMGHLCAKCVRDAQEFGVELALIPAANSLVDNRACCC